jgi:hypothetical protein
MDPEIERKVNDVIARIDAGSEPHAVRIPGVVSVELMESDASIAAPKRIICEDGREATCQIGHDSKGRQICIWVC